MLLELNMNPSFVYSQLDLLRTDEQDERQKYALINCCAINSHPVFTTMLSARAAATRDVKPDDVKILEKTSRRVELRLVR